MEGGKLVHSHSQPGGMDRTPPGTPKKGGKMLAVRVQMLDDSITMFQVQVSSLFNCIGSPTRPSRDQGAGRISYLVRYWRNILYLTFWNNRYTSVLQYLTISFPAFFMEYCAAWVSIFISMSYCPNPVFSKSRIQLTFYIFAVT